MTEMIDTRRIAEDVAAACVPFRTLLTSMRTVVVGQESLLDGLVLAMLCGGHALIEGVPGLAKTTAVSALARAIHTDFQRLQFTPDLLPADVIGTLIYRPADGRFEVRKGPIFANVVLADEINRAPAKVQSALLEAMQERQVTIGTETFPLPDPFLVLATQNPVEQEGTYPLPEAQVDRFMFKLVVDYPSVSEERAILDRWSGIVPAPVVTPVMEPEAIRVARAVVAGIHVDEKIRDYIVRLVHATRVPAAYGLEIEDLIRYGASPRATIGLSIASRARAFLDGRGFVVPQDVKDVALAILRHRLIISYEAEAEGRTSEDLVATILDHLPVP